MKMTDVKEVKNVERSDSRRDSVSENAQKELESLIALKKTDLVDEYLLERVLKDNIQKKMASIFATITPEKVKELYASVENPEERAALELLFKEYEEKDRNEKEKKKEINAVIDQTKLELHYFQEDVVMENASYGSERLIDQTPDVKLPEKELKIFDRMLAGKGVIEGKLTKLEQSMRRDFRKAFLESGMDIRGFFYGFNTLAKSGVAVEKDWKNVFSPRERSKGWSESQQKKFQNGYFAYLEAKKGSPQLSRWTQIITSIETGLLNEGKQIAEVYTQSLNLPIAKKAWKQTLRNEEASWRADYENKHQAQLAQARAHWVKRYKDQGYTTSEAENYAEEVIQKDLQKKWNQHLKELQDTGIQKADLGKFAYLLEAIKDKPLQSKITTLLTDTNFDGMRTHLDGVGVKGGMQLEDTLHEVLNGKTPLKREQVVKNIAAFTKERMNIGAELSSEATPEEFYTWMAADIRHARAVQSALMDSPMDMKDILRHGTDAFKETLKSYALTPEQLQLLQTKVDTDPETKDLSAADKQLVMSTTSAYLLAKMKEAGPQAGINGLGVGVNIPFEKYLEGLSFTLGTGLTNEGVSYLGVGLAWNHKVTEWNIEGNK